MPELIVMPKMGLTATDAILVEWHIDIGDQVEEGDVIGVVETDKIAADIESTASGTLLRRIEVDQLVPIGEPIAVIGEPDADVSDVQLYDPDRAATVRGPDEDTETPTGATPAGGDEEESLGSGGGDTAGRTKVSPAARRLAKELDVDLDTIDGSGPGGRITSEDVKGAASQGTGQRVELTPLRRAVARNMSRSAAVPQFSLEREIEVAVLLDRLSDQPGPRDERATVVDVLGAALARCLRSHPRFLCSWNEDHLVQREHVDIGMAVALDEGLMVPVIRSADEMSASGIARRRRELQRHAQEGQLNNDDVGRAVFTISNLGPFGIDRFTALVDPPQAGILAVGRIRDREPQTMSVTLSADHRVVDGADGARLLQDLAEHLTDAPKIDELLEETDL